MSNNKKTTYIQHCIIPTKVWLCPADTDAKASKLALFTIFIP
ncbi:hypothetical protein SAMN04488096_1335, partial [Mesonia phycicola]